MLYKRTFRTILVEVFFPSKKGLFFFELQEDKDTIKLRIAIFKIIERCEQDDKLWILEQTRRPSAPCTFTVFPSLGRS